MSTRGPVPKRSEERRRRNKENHQVEQAPSATLVPTASPEPDPDWHPVALDFFVSLSHSGQSQFYEPSDWALAVYVTEAMSNSLNHQREGRMSAHMFAAVLAGATELMASEGSRRRLRLELTRDDTPKENAGVTALNEYRRALTGG